MMLVLMAVAFAAADLITSSEVHSFLIGRLDEQIGSEEGQLVGFLNHVYSQQVRSGDTLALKNPSKWLEGLNAVPLAHRPHLPDDPTTEIRSISAESLFNRIGPNDFVEVIDGDGTDLFEHTVGALDAPSPPPDLYSLRMAGDASDPDAIYRPDQSAFEVAALGQSSLLYRVHTASVPGGVLVVAVSEAPSQTTLSSLAHIEILVSVIVMLVLAALVLWTVRIGLRPLEDMTETAGAFAKGDLSRRVRFVDEKTEVGRLGRALNGMLVQIESAFGKRKESEDRLRRFVADASHDLRTPLTSIRGYAELLRKGAYDNEDDRRRAISRIEHEAERMAILVDDLLLLARLDQGRPLGREAVEIRPLVADAVAGACAADPYRPISLEAPHGILVQGDSGRLRQAVDNLLRNALVHTPPGTPVRVKVETTSSSTLISVSDNGPGIKPEESSKIFDRFFQADPSRTGQGTGLGLSIVAAIAEAHGGRSWVETTLGLGSTFYIELPLDTASPRPAEAIAKADLTDLAPPGGSERAGYVGT
jgi:two-component system OmpR family sensor kinase